MYRTKYVFVSLRVNVKICIIFRKKKKSIGISRIMTNITNAVLKILIFLYINFELNAQIWINLYSEREKINDFLHIS